MILGGQKLYLDKTGLGFEKEDDMKSSKESQNQILACIYCFKKGHTSEKMLLQKES